MLPDLENVIEVRIGDKATNAHLATFARLKGLRSLDLNFNKNITDAGLERLKGLAKFTRLGLMGLAQIKSIMLSKRATDKSLEPLKEIRKGRRDSVVLSGETSLLDSGRR